MVRFSQSLAGKQDWYGVQCGIWKPARLEARDPVHIRELAIRTAYDGADGAVVAKGKLSAPTQAKIRMTVSRRDQTLATCEFEIGAAEFDVRLAVRRAVAWSPDDPNLYQLAVEVMRDKAPVDAVDAWSASGGSKRKTGASSSTASPSSCLARWIRTGIPRKNAGRRTLSFSNGGS